ncbi:coiled-coil domain-containing protein 115 [Ornithorhynchus anatinus]|uniref:Vacuolar ATPase assembly protein VMA22 n=1 Tax=Ornithorhynchus anatinus TaxID=9258 RepID=A0A6I8NGF8_ORNAN|nr:coiled-coil domain-containing protein 115 [Ornithorhynchus anatinus]
MAEDGEGEGEGRRCRRRRLRTVCEELDRLVFRLLEELDELQGKRAAFNGLVEQGWFSLSKARYAMGNKSVSTLQYGHQMTPLLHVSISVTEDGEQEFQVVTRSSHSPEPPRTDLPPPEEIGPQEQALRQRKGRPEGTAPSAATTPPSSPKAPGPQESKKSAPRQDPLTWFGILVPQSLRQAQSTFREGILLAGDIATLQNSIEKGRARFRTLHQEKRQLQGALTSKSP